MVTAVVVMRRGHSAEPAPVVAKELEKPALPPIIDATVLATDVIKLQRNAVEPVVDNGQTLGVKVKDPELARVLGLDTDDVIVSLSGRVLTRDMDIYDAVFNVSMMSGTTMYAEITRAGTPTLLRWKLDGDLRQARYANAGNTLGGLYGGTYTPPPLPPPDPILDTIEKVDDTHVKMPRKTAEHIFSNPMATMKGARVVPAVKNGQPSGIKLYAIRPSSVFAKLGFANGDTIEDINGVAITSADKALELYTKLPKLDQVKVTLTRRGNPMQLTITITK
ncbi:MAG TPA: PDZ domain-containing protein [Kofleriaceae bacterium]|nr:PDZ domain-containing protein [Kofleriaceae bacterium]